jgi:uncharacterized protein
MTPTQNKFSNKYGPWGIVTGASSGIGRSLAKELARKGLNLVLVSRSVNLLDQLATEIREESGSECKVLVLDLAEDTGVESLEQLTRDLDVGLLVASAGFGSSGSFLDNPLEPELDMLNVNCRSSLALSWHFGRRFVARGGGGIILLSSIVSFQGNPWASHYAATKAYIQTLAEGLAIELKQSKVDLLSVAPGPTNTGFAHRAEMKMGAALDPDRIAPDILHALGRKGTILPGALSKILVYSMMPLPRWARIQIMGMVMHAMARKNGT